MLKMHGRCKFASSMLHVSLYFLFCLLYRGYTGKNVVVTILDDGIQPNHPELAKNYVSKPIHNFFIFN